MVYVYVCVHKCGHLFKVTGGALEVKAEYYLSQSLAY